MRPLHYSNASLTGYSLVEPKSRFAFKEPRTKSAEWSHSNWQQAFVACFFGDGGKSFAELHEKKPLGLSRKPI